MLVLFISVLFISRTIGRWAYAWRRHDAFAIRQRARDRTRATRRSCRGTAEHCHKQERALPWSSEGRAALCAHMEARQPSRGIRHYISTPRALGGGRGQSGRAASCQHRRGPSLAPLGCMAACSMCIEPRAFMAGGDTYRPHGEHLERRSQPQHHLEEQQPPGQAHVEGQHSF